jgi:hypothetical protein
MKYIVKSIDRELTLDFILNKHYAKRVPSISYSFGLYDKDLLVGVLTIGKPASNSLCVGVCGKELSKNVYELNRLVVNDGLPKNTLSYFVSNVIKQLKNEDLILISYADTGMNHCGYIYQATNWIYTGITVGRTDKYTPGNKHSRHYSDEYNHLRKVRTPKHRYIYFIGKNKKNNLKELKYDVMEYPKKENKRYKLGDKIETKIIDTTTNTYFYE